MSHWRSCRPFAEQPRRCRTWGLIRGQRAEPDGHHKSTCCFTVDVYVHIRRKTLFVPALLVLWSYHVTPTDIAAIVYLGTTSNWSFSGKLLQMAYENLHQAPLPPGMLLFDGSAYDLGWNSRASLLGPSSGADSSNDDPPLALPSLDYSEYLINAVKFHCGQIFHLFDDSDFHQRLQQFYAEPDRNVAREKAGLWYIHFLLILAFGKIFIMKKPVGRRPCGAEFFLKAMQILPPAHVLCHDPVAATEMLCCIALYLQSVDHRNAAHIFVRLHSWFLPLVAVKLTSTLDRPSYAYGSRLRHAHRYASDPPWRGPCTEVSQDLVDGVHIGSANDKSDGTAPVHPRRRCPLPATSLSRLPPTDSLSRPSHQAGPLDRRGQQQ